MLKTENTEKLTNAELSLFLKELMGEDEYAKVENEINAEVGTPKLEVVSKSAEEIAEKVVSEKPKAKKESKPRVKLPTEKDKRVLATLGDKLNDFALLEISDEHMGEEHKKQCVDELLERLSKVPQKIGNRITYFAEYIAGVKVALPEVLEMAVRLLHKDKHISAKNSKYNAGNFFKKLIDRPYSPTSAAAMGTNTVKAMQVLKLVVPDGNGELVVNPASRHWLTLVKKLGLD